MTVEYQISYNVVRPSNNELGKTTVSCYTTEDEEEAYQALTDEIKAHVADRECAGCGPTPNMHGYSLRAWDKELQLDMTHLVFQS